MKKNFKLYAVVWAILLIVFNVLVFATPSEYNGESKFTSTFYIGYALVMVGFVGQLVCTFLGLREDNLQKLFYNIPLLKISMISLVVTAVAGSVFMAIPAAQPWIASVVSVLALAFSAIAVIKAKATGDIVSDIDNKIKAKTSFIKGITLDAEMLMTSASTPEIKSEIKKVYEAFRFSDPMSNDALDDVEGRIQNQFNLLQEVVITEDAERTSQIAKDLLSLIDYRNKKCKITK